MSMSEDEFKEKMVTKMEQLTLVVQQGFASGEKRMDAQDRNISDIIDQIKGNEDKGIQGIRPAIREYGRILVIPILIKKLPMWAKWLLAIITVDAIADANSIGFITCLKYIIHIVKP